MNWVLITSNNTKKFLKKLAKKEALRLGLIIDDLLSNPYQGDIQRIGGESDVWRRRADPYRIIYEVNTGRKIIHILDIRRRTSTTY